MKTKKPTKQTGLTLVEVLLYLAILATFLSVITSFIIILFQSRIKSETMEEVEFQGELIMQEITQSIRDAESINSPSQGNSADSLSLEMPSASNNPTVYSLSGNTLQIQEGSASSVNLSNSKVNVTALTFENLTRDNGSGIIKITYTIERINPENRNEYEYTKSFYNSATIRN